MISKCIIELLFGDSCPSLSVCQFLPSRSCCDCCGCFVNNAAIARALAGSRPELRARWGEGRGTHGGRTLYGQRPTQGWDLQGRGGGRRGDSPPALQFTLPCESAYIYVGMGMGIGMGRWRWVGGFNDRIGCWFEKKMLLACFLFVSLIHDYS